MRKLLLLMMMPLLAAVLPARAKSVPVAGTFQTSYGDFEIVEMILTQEGDKVTGNYAYNNGAVEGELDGRILKGRWTEDGASGSFELEFSRDGKSFEGWRTDGNSPDKVDWTGVMTAAPKGKGWVLVSRETTISNETFTSDGSYFDHDGKRVKVPIHFTMKGTAEDITVQLTGNDLGFRGVSEWSFTMKGGHTPLTGPYQPGQTILCGMFHHNEGMTGESATSQMFAFLGGMSVTTDGGKTYKSVYNTDYHSDQRYEYTFPTHAEAGSDCLDIILFYQFGVAHEELKTVCHFEWNGHADGTAAGPAGWFVDIFGEGEHTDALWTIFISGGAASLAIGAIASMISGMTPPSAPAGSGGVPEVPETEAPPVDPADDKKKRGFFRDDDPYYVRQNVRENSDGTLTLIDPGGGPRQTLYPKYDEEGNRIGWFNQNFTDYDDEGIREWTRWRAENANNFRQDTAQAAINVAEQRAMNEARDQADRERGSTQAADEIRQWEKHQEHMQKLGDKYGVDPEDTETLKQKIRRDMKQAAIEGAEHEGRAAWWDERIAEAELTEKVCDTIIDNVGEATPETKALKAQYHFFKSVGQRAMEGISDNQGAGHFATKLGQGLTEAMIDRGFSEETWKKHSTLDKLTGGEEGRSVGSAVFKSLMSDAIDGDKDVSEMIDNAVKAGTSQAGSDLVGKVVGKQIKKADLAGATESHANVVGALGGDWLTQTVSNPVAEDISNSFNNWRKDTFGV